MEASAIQIPNNDSSLVIRFKNIVDSTVITDVQAFLTFKNNDGIYEFSVIVEDSAELPVPKAKYNLTVFADDIRSLGKDYFGEYVLNTADNNEFELVLFPVGTISGTVLDRLDNLVGNAKLKFECSTDNGDLPPDYTEEYGSFTYDYAPVGDCRVSALYRDAAGFETIRVTQGNISHITIKLDKTIVSDEFFSSDSSFLLPLGIFVLLIVSFFMIKIKKPKNEDNVLDRRTKDVLKTLSEREKCVVHFLLENNYESTQNVIKHKTKIPKTSLIRIFDKLEQKKIISVDSLGTLKKIKLTDWFLGRE